MGLIHIISDKKVYLDANIFIYAIEQVTPYRDVIGDLFEQIDAKNLLAYTSTLTLAEVLVKPFMDNNQALIDIYENLLLDANIINLAEINQQILIQSAQYRSKFNLKLPDAIHLATSKQLATDFFLTNDKAIKADPTMKILQLVDFS